MMAINSKIALANLLSIVLLSACADSVDHQPILGLIKPSQAGNAVLYVTTPSLAAGTAFYVLSPDMADKRVWCCVKVSSPASNTDSEESFISPPNESGHTDIAQHAYLATPLTNSGVNLRRLNIVVKANSVRVNGNGYEATDAGGNPYMIDSCFGAEGINVYLRDSRTHAVLDHYYGYLGYDIESDCPTSRASP